MKVIYFDCAGGISGDMTVAALLDAGADIGIIKKHLPSLKEGHHGLGISIRTRKVFLKGLSALCFDALTKKNHRHSRSLLHIDKIISASGFSQKTKKTAKQIFRTLARAESVVHGKKLKDAMLHEAGQDDSIVDILASAALVENLGAEKIIFSPLPLGRGKIKCAHGILPLPAPAALEIIKENKIPVIGVKCSRETVTPTGAAITATLADGFAPMPAIKIEKIGCGAGSLSKEPADILRVIIGTEIKYSASWRKKREKCSP